MKASCRFAMAVHVLTVLAYKEGGRVSSALLAASVNTNPVIVRRLLLALQKARLIDTHKGPGFGSRLSRAPARINLAEVYRAVEPEEPFAMPRGKPNDACPVGQGIGTVLGKIFVSAHRALERDLAQTTLARVLNAVRDSRARAGTQPVIGRSRRSRSQSQSFMAIGD